MAKQVTWNRQGGDGKGTKENKRTDGSLKKKKKMEVKRGGKNGL